MLDWSTFSALWTKALVKSSLDPVHDSSVRLRHSRLVKPSTGPGVEDEGVGRLPPRHRVLKGFLGILSGTSLAQVLALAAVPLLSRLYTPEDAAHYALVLGAALVVASIAALRLDLAIPLPDSLKESRQLFWLAALMPLLTIPAVSVLALGLGLMGLSLPPEVSIIDYVALAAFVFALCLYAAGSQLAVRLRAYGVLARIPVLQMIGTLLAQLGLGSLGFGRGLFLGALFGRSLGFAGLLRASGIRMTQAPSKTEAIGLLRRFWRFPVIFAPAALVNVLGSNLTALMLPALMGLGPAGLFAMAVRVAAVPAAVLSDSAGQVFVGEFARAGSRSQSYRVFARWSAGLLLLGFLVASATWFLAPLTLPVMLGDDWAGTGQLAQYAGIMAGAGIFAAPLQDVWRVRQRGLMLFSWNTLRLSATAWVIWAGAEADASIYEVALNLAYVTAGVYFISWVGCLVAVGRKPAGQRAFEREAAAAELAVNNAVTQIPGRAS